MGLNPEQLRAVKAGEGPVLIVAGPGTGKTKTLTARIAYLLANGAKPGEIIALTFTNKAAREMRERLAGVLGGGAKLPKICTFHALGADLLRRDGTHRALAKDTEQQEIIRSLERPTTFKGVSVRELTLLISRAKTSLSPLDANTKRLLETHEAVLAAQGLHDYDDLLCKSYDLLKNDSTKRPGHTYILVDEFQDTSELQYELLKLLCTGENIFAIGDPNQSIYGWRGAGAEMFARFRTDFPSVKEIALTENYRSRPEIVRLANAIFPDSPQLLAQTEEPGTVQAVQTLNEYSEAAYVLGEIEKGIGGSTFLSATSEDGGREPRDYAVLYRTHQAGKAIQKAFAESGIPYQIAGDGSPYEQPDVQEVITGLRAIENTENRLIGDIVAQLAAEHDMALENLSQLLSTFVQFGSDLPAALAHLDDIAEQEFYDPSVNAVTLMTIHASKGLEFAHVFLVAAEEGILPKRKHDTIDEERRLFYVAATRAKHQLDVLYARTRAGEPATLSRFVTELSETVVPRTTDPAMASLEKRLQKKAQKRAQTKLF